LSADQNLVRYLQTAKYHPRSSAHGDKLCELVLADLLDLCVPFRTAAKQRRIVYTLNHVIDAGSPTQWNLDLVAGPPTSPQQHLKTGDAILRGEPAEIWLAVDAKTIMTEHGKTRRNRQRDLNSLHDILHRKNPKTIVGGLIVLNMAERFKSPLRPKITTHRNVERLVHETVDMFRGLPLSKKGGTGLDALGMIVIAHTNVDGDETKLISTDPSPKRGDPLHYSTFLEDICSTFAARFGP